MDGVVRFINNSYGGEVNLYERRDRVTHIVSEMLNDEDRVNAELDLAGNKIKRISNMKNICVDITLAIGGGAFCCSGVILNLTSVCFCNPPYGDREGNLTNTSLGTTLCAVGGMMLGTGLTNLWRHLNKKDDLNAERRKIEERLSAVERRNDSTTDEHAEHSVAVQQLVSVVMNDPNISGIPVNIPMSEMPFEPPPYSERNEQSVRRQLFQPNREELPSISELPEYGEHTGDRLLEAGMIHR